MKVSFWKKLSLFLTYRNTLRKIKGQLLTSFGARVDNVSRIYTVVNVPESLIEEPYNVRKSDIDTIAKTFIKDYSSELSRFLNSNGLMELYDFYEVEKVGKYSYLVILGFSLFNTQKFFSRLYYIYLPSILVLLIAVLLFFL